MRLKGGGAGKKEKGREKDRPFSLQFPLDFFLCSHFLNSADPNGLGVLELRDSLFRNVFIFQV